MAPKVFGLFPVFALLAAACGVIGDETLTPTRDVPTFSSEAAIGLVSNNCRNASLAAHIRSEASAFYQGNGVWLVHYQWTTTKDARWEVYEAGGLVAPIGESPVHVYCQREPSQ